MIPEVRGSRRERRKQRMRRRLLLSAAVLVGLIVAYYAVAYSGMLAKRKQIRQIVNDNGLVVSGLSLDWNLDASLMAATVYVLNPSDLEIRGHLVFELSPRADRLDRTYLEKLAAGRRARQLQGSLEALEQSGGIDPRRAAILSYLRRGHTTEYPDYEAVIYPEGSELAPLVFRKKTIRVVIPPGELASYTLAQTLPAFRMGELITIEGVRLIDVDFDG